MSTTTANIADTSVDLTDETDAEFARGAARYLRQAGLSDDAIVLSLVDELGIDLTNARRIALTL